MLKIGFAARSEKQPGEKNVQSVVPQSSAPVRSLVRVHFPARNMTLSYYNDSFNLKRGDIVYVDGKLEGLRGHVVDITYNFKIKLSDYKRIISVADTNVHGEFHFVGSHFVTFDPLVLPYEKVITWFKAPDKEDDEYVSGNDNTGFSLDNLSSMKVSHEIAERGHDYYMENKVRYLCLDNAHGRAIVEGTRAYELEFELVSGEVRNLTCNCYCSYPCKHEFAAMLQLKETLDLLETHYAKQYEETGYFAAISKGTLLNFAVDGNEIGSFTLN